MAKGTIIPNGEVLFRYIDPKSLPTGQVEIPVSVFNDSELSCDWERYKTDPNTSYHINEGKTRVIAISVCDGIRNIRNPKGRGEIVDAWTQEIIHDPISAEDDSRHGANESHSLIIGKKKAAVVDSIRNNSMWFEEYLKIKKSIEIVPTKPENSFFFDFANFDLKRKLKRFFLRK